MQTERLRNKNAVIAQRKGKVNGKIAEKQFNRELKTTEKTDMPTNRRRS